MGDRNCASSGFLAFNTTIHNGIPPMSLSLDVYGRPPKDVVAMSRLAGGLCGQALIDEAKASTEALKAAGLERRYCIERGYGEAAGNQEVEVPVLGKFQLALFRKTGELDVMDALRVSVGAFAADALTVHMVSGDVCGQTSIANWQYQSMAAAVTGFARGPCKDTGFTQSVGSKEMTVPVIGKLEVALFKRPTAAPVIV